MAIALRNIGFDFLCDNDDLLKKFVATNLSESKSIPNYYGGQYLYHYIGVPETLVFFEASVFHFWISLFRYIQHSIYKYLNSVYENLSN